MSYFPIMTPESQGICSSAVIEFIKDIERKGLELHRLMIIRHGKCIAKGCYAPYEESDFHPAYSFSKSLTATAIGFAIQEGVLTLDDRLVDHLSEFVPDESEVTKEHLAYLNKVKIRHLLTMSCGQEEEIDSDKAGAGWILSFMRQEILHEPGTFFKYNTAGTNILAAILKKTTGKSITEYLKPRLFDPVGMGEVLCYELPDAYNTQLGGGGMKLTLEDMARFSYFMLNKGHFEGKAILPGWYEQAGIKQIETAGDSEGHIKDWAYGYGYQCWMCNLPGSYRADGAFGQFGLIYPTLDLIVVMNAATEMTQQIMDSVNEILLPSCQDAPVKENQEAYQCLVKTMEDLHIQALTGSRNPVFEEILEGRTYHAVTMNGHSLSGLTTLVGGAGLRQLDHTKEITDMRFSFTDESVLWYFTEDGKERMIEASFAHTFAKLKLMTECGMQTFASTARWRGNEALEMEIRRLDAMSGVRLIFRFDDSIVEIEADETLMTQGGLGMSPKRLVPFACE